MAGFTSESLAAFHRNGWPTCIGISGWLGSEYAPVTALFQNLEDGAHVSDFIDWFPGVTLAQVRAVLEHAARSLEAA